MVQAATFFFPERGSGISVLVMFRAVPELSQEKIFRISGFQKISLRGGRFEDL